MSDRVRSLRVPNAVVQAAVDQEDRGLRVPDEATCTGAGENAIYKWTEAFKIINTKVGTNDKGWAEITVQAKVTPNSPSPKNRGRNFTNWNYMLQGDDLANADLTKGHGIMSVITVGNARQLIKACGFDPGPVDQFDICEWFDAPDGAAKPLIGCEVLGKMVNKLDTYKLKKDGPNEDGSSPRKTELVMWASAE